MATFADYLDKLQTDTATVAADQDALTQAQAAVKAASDGLTAANDKLAADQAVVASDNQTIAAELANGMRFVAGPGDSVTLYVADTSAAGYHTVVVQPASAPAA